MQRRRRDHRQRLGVALHDREAPPAPAHAGRDGGALAAAAAVRQPGGRPGRSGVRRCAAWRSTRAARSSRAAPSTTIDLVMVDVARGHGATSRPFDPSDERSALAALALGTRDYARRCGFRQALLGLSGGIDSALVACIAARALGPEQVLGVAMPSRYSSPGSLADAEALARDAGHRLLRRVRSSRCSPPTSTRWRRALEQFAPARPPAACRGRRRSDRAEPAGARPRRDADGAVEPAGSAAADAPATRARSRPATARCTATWRAGSR